MAAGEQGVFESHHECSGAIAQHTGIDLSAAPYYSAAPDDGCVRLTSSISVVARVFASDVSFV